MILWFVILAPVLVAEIFQSPMADYRVVAVGAALPLVEAALVGPRYLHTMVVAMGLLAVVMLATSNRRLVRRRLLGIPIGLLLHLVLDFTWVESELLWWPAFGFDFDEQATAVVNRPLEIGLLLDIVALAAGVWAYRRYELDNPDNRDLLIRSGRLARSAMPQ